ncbi:P44/Msp2 family outer membrane protein, partial [Anaplasma capra]|uniref:P44/Msp2 family outer membrane protein n=1 Tax=Anaplasma capra TaxID=1562740 RepID=UPI002950072E
MWLSPGSARTGSFYIGLDYNPTFSEVKDFKFEGDGNTTRGIFPLKGDAGNDFRSHDFDWDAPASSITFSNSPVALGGSIGYRMGRARIEVGIGHERFVTKGNSVFLLGKELALDTVRSQ